MRGNPDIYAGAILRIRNSAGGKDWWYEIVEIQMGDTNAESVIILKGLTRKLNQETFYPEYHVPLAIFECCEGLMVEPEFRHDAPWRQESKG